MFFNKNLTVFTSLPNPDNKKEVNHRDEVKTHNWVGNLEFCDHSYNINYGTRNERASASKRDGSKGKKQVYCPELDEIFPSTAAVKEKYGIDQGSVSKCCHGKRNYVGRHPITGEKLHWQFV